MRSRWFEATKAVRAAFLRLERLEDRNAPSDSLSSLSAPLANSDIALTDTDNQKDDSHSFSSNYLNQLQSSADEAIAVGGADLLPSTLPATSLSAPATEMTGWVPHGVDLSNVNMPGGVDLGFGGDGSIEPMARRNYVSGLTPVQTRHAYGFDQLGSSYTGAGRTIAIVDAYNASKIVTDLQTFNTQFGLQKFNVSGGPTFKVVNQAGGSSLPASNSGWALESALDVEWAHAVAPQANIVLVEAKSSSYSDLMSAVNYAANNAQVVSMSWGGGDWSGETSLDSYFRSHPNVAFVASSGDSGYGVEYPSASPYVLSVGGTQLNVDSSGNRISETAWSGSGGGISAVESEPTYQKNFGITNASGKRANPDVAYDASPSTGVYVYSAEYGGWYIVGGTSAGAPQWAGLIALADQQRAAHGLGMLSTTNTASSPFYNAASTSALYAANYYDITSGSNGKVSTAQAHTGYDFVTGLGSPDVKNLVPYLATH
ncbi:MAG TPA: S53 family peptidase [Gemmataceae bacterium]|nr:S53 family peptidase [Gemmataceae bacterium]